VVYANSITRTEHDDDSGEDIEREIPFLKGYTVFNSSRSTVFRKSTTPDGCVIDVETALLQQLLNIAQRERIAKIPPERTEYEAGFGLTPLEDRGSGYHFAILSRHQPATLEVATHPRSLFCSHCRHLHRGWFRESGFR
jgi:hypothetical protein